MRLPFADGVDQAIARRDARLKSMHNLISWAVTLSVATRSSDEYRGAPSHGVGFSQTSMWSGVVPHAMMLVEGRLAGNGESVRVLLWEAVYVDMAAGDRRRGCHRPAPRVSRGLG